MRISFLIIIIIIIIIIINIIIIIALTNIQIMLLQAIVFLYKEWRLMFCLGVSEQV